MSIKDNWKNVGHVHCGLSNMQNSSSLNAVMQSLFHIPAFVDWVDNDHVHRQECKNENGCATCCIGDLLMTMKGNNVVSPSHLLEVLQCLFNDVVQSKDPALLLFHILCRLDAEYVQRGNNTSPFSNDEKKDTPISLMFESSLRYEALCNHCGVEMWTFADEVYFAVLPGIAEKNVQHAVLGWLQFQVNTNSDLMCTCGQEMQKWNKVSYHTPPYLLTIKVPRFDDEKKKDTTPLSISTTLTVPGGLRYDFVAGIFHDGVSPLVGHFFSVVVCPDGSLSSFQDALITKVSYATFATNLNYSSNSYLLIYARKSVQQVSHQDIAHLSTTPTLVMSSPNKGTPKKRKRRYIIGKHSPGITEAPISKKSPWKVKELPSSTVEAVAQVSEDIIQSPEEGNHHHALEPTHRDIGVQVSTLRFRICYEVCKNMTPKRFMFFTGVNQLNFEVLFEFLGGKDVINSLKMKVGAQTPHKNKSKLKLTARDRLFMTLVRLRRGVPIIDLATVYDMGKSQAAEIVYNVIRHMCLAFKSIEKNMLTSAEDQKKKPLPFRCFRNLRIIIDGVEIRVQTPSDFQQQGNTFSNYKSTNTVLFIVGISCFGAITFISSGFEGCMSDKEAVIKSGLLDLIEEGESIMADRGFQIEKECEERGITLIKPPHLHGRKTFTAEEEIITRAIAASRIYVEHAIRKIKEFRLLRLQVPLTLMPILPDIVFVCGCLVNFREPYIKKSKH